MADAVILPKLGQTVEEATIVRWCKSEGEKISKGDILFEIETDKAVLEVESFFEGILLKVLSGDGAVLPVNTVVGYIGKQGESVPDKAPAAAPAPAPVPTPATQKEEKTAAEPVKTETVSQPVKAPAAAVPQAPARPAPVPVQQEQRIFISPRAKKLVESKAVNPARIHGSGPNGRIRVSDVEAYLERSGYNNLRISPAAKKMAVTENIDILTVKPTGSGGRIMVDDIRRAIAEKPAKMTKMRQVISSRLTQSFRDTPHFYVTVSADMTELLQYRQELKEQGEVYSVTDFILEAVVLSLEEFPIVNSFTDGHSVSWRGTVDLGLAVGLDDGLVVPAIRDAGSLSLRELHDVAKDLAERARAGKLMPDEMTGSSFTVSNMGMFGVECFNAIINPGEGAILAVASTQKQPVVIDDEIKIRSIMKMTLSVDHRIIDGVMGAQFVNAVKDKLENVEMWRMLV